MGTLRITTTLLLTALLVACGGGADSEIDTPIADIQAKAAEADTASLEATIEDYKAAIAARKDEVAELAKDSAEAAKDAIGDMLGDAEEASDDAADELKARAAELNDELENLGERMAVYAEELKKKMSEG